MWAKKWLAGMIGIVCLPFFGMAEGTLYYGGDIVTMKGEKPQYVETVVEVNGTIAFTGKRADAQKRFASARQVDLNGSTLMPAFFDPHGHLLLTTLLVAYADLNVPPIGSVDSIEKLRKHCRSTRPPTSWDRMTGSSG